MLGVKYTAVPGYRGLKDVETAILQNEGQFANTSLPGWSASIGPTMAKQGIVVGLFHLVAPGPDGVVHRSVSLPDMPTFDEFYEKVHGKKPSGIAYESLRLMTDILTSMFRTVFTPAHTPDEAVTALRAGFVSMWKDKAFIADYSKAVKSTPVMVTGEEGEKIISTRGSCRGSHDIWYEVLAMCGRAQDRWAETDGRLPRQQTLHRKGSRLSDPHGAPGSAGFRSGTADARIFHPGLAGV